MNTMPKTANILNFFISVKQLNLEISSCKSTKNPPKNEEKHDKSP